MSVLEIGRPNAEKTWKQLNCENRKIIADQYREWRRVYGTRSARIFIRRLKDSVALASDHSLWRLVSVMGNTSALDDV